MSKAKLESHTGPVYAVAAHYDSTAQLLILSGGGDDKSFLHQIVPGNAPSTRLLPHAHSDTVSCVALNHAYVSDDLVKTPKLAAVGGYDGAIVLYDPDTGTKLKELEGPSDVEWLCFHPKGGSVCNTVVVLECLLYLNPLSFLKYNLTLCVYRFYWLVLYPTEPFGCITFLHPSVYKSLWDTRVE